MQSQANNAPQGASEAHAEPDEPLMKVYQMGFSGSGLTLGRLMAKKWALGILTLGAYVPWANVPIRRFLARSTRFYGEPFAYHGDPKEVFVNYLLLVGFFLCAGFLAFLGKEFDELVYLFILSLYGLLVALYLPFSLYSAACYRASRTSWGRFPVRVAVDVKGFMVQFLLGAVFTAISCGFYFPFLVDRCYRFVCNRVGIGDLQFRYTGDSRVLFRWFFSSVLLTVPTLGLNWFWFWAKTARYLANQTWVGSPSYGAARGFLDLRGGDLIGIAILNLACIIPSIGLALPWAICFNYDFLTKRLKLYGDVNFDALLYGEAQQATDVEVEDEAVEMELEENISQAS